MDASITCARLLLGASVVLAITGCAGRAPAPSATLPPSVAAHAEARHGDFVVTFDLPKSTWRSLEPMTGEARLIYTGSGTATITSSGGGPFGFELGDGTGTAILEPTWTLDCMTRQMTSAAPITSALGKSGALDTPFAASFLTDPEYRLPPGDWTITADAWFGGPDCGSAAHVRASIRILVVP